jgi:transposase-like protein
VLYKDKFLRGVKRVDLVVSDALAGIEEAVAKHYSQVSHQFCVFHLKKNVLKYIKPKDKHEIAKQLVKAFQVDNSNDSIEKGWQR